jgi:hypothetical protein
VLRNKLFHLLAAFVAVLVFASCNKEPNLIGLDLLPEGDRLNMSFIDTSTIIAYTVKEDSLRTDELSTNLIGYIDDPVFGKTLGSVYTHFNLPTLNFSFGTNPVADSVILSLVYNGIYGDSLSQHTFRVFELADTMSLGAAYYSNSAKATIPNQIGVATFVPNLLIADSVDGEKVPPHLRIALSQEFSNRLINADATTLSSNSFFTDVFRGLYITADPVTSNGTGALLYFNLLEDWSKITVHYHNSTDTSRVSFPINSNCARFNKYIHYYYVGASPELLQQFAGDTISGNDRVFMQAMAGAKVKLRMPFLKNIPENSRIAVNEAILVLTDDEPGSVFAPPSQLAMRALDDTGAYVVMADETIGSVYFGGRYVNKKEYRFRLTKYVQDRMSNPDAKDNGLMMVIAGSSLSGNRVVLKGPANTTGRMKLLIYYTLIE